MTLYSNLYNPDFVAVIEILCSVNICENITDDGSITMTFLLSGTNSNTKFLSGRENNENFKGELTIKPEISGVLINNTSHVSPTYPVPSQSQTKALFSVIEHTPLCSQGFGKHSSLFYDMAHNSR